MLFLICWFWSYWVSFFFSRSLLSPFLSHLSPCRWGTWQAPPSVVYCSASSSLWTPVCRHSSRRWVRLYSPRPEESWPPQVYTYTHSEAITVILALLPFLIPEELWTLKFKASFNSPFVCMCVCVCVCRLSTTPRWSARPRRLHPVKPLRCSRLDASNTDGPERPSQWPTAYRGTQTHIYTHTVRNI